MTDAKTTLRRHGGERSRAYFASLLGLDRADDYQVRAVDLGGKEFEVAVKPRSGQDLRLAIASKRRMRQAYISSRHLALSFKAGASPIPPRFEEILRRSVPSRFGGLTFSVLARAMDDDPDAWSDPSPKRLPRSARKPARAVSPSAAGPDFSDFLAREDILRQKAVNAPWDSHRRSGAAGSRPMNPAGRQGRWRELTRRARSHTLGIVVRDSEAEQFVDPAYTCGVPVLSALREMGFGLEIFLRSASRKSAAQARAVLETRLKRHGRVSYARFDSFESMMRCLSRSACRAVFSNYFFDWRVTSAGKAIFSLRHFEAGSDGAIRTVERLIQACETGYYRRYGRYLQRDRNGEPRWKARAFR